MYWQMLILKSIKAAGVLSLAVNLFNFWSQIEHSESLVHVGWSLLAGLLSGAAVYGASKVEMRVLKEFKTKAEADIRDQQMATTGLLANQVAMQKDLTYIRDRIDDHFDREH